MCADGVRYSNVVCTTLCGVLSVSIWDDFGDNSNNRFKKYDNVYGVENPMVMQEVLCMGTVGDYIIMSEVLEPMSELHVMFKLWTRSSVGEASVALAVGMNRDDWSTFEYIDTFTVRGENMVKVFERNFIDYEGDGQFIALMGLDTGIYVDDILVDIVPGCSYPYDLGVSNVTLSSARVSWRDDNVWGNSYNWMLVYGIEGEEMDTVIVDSTWHDLTGLLMNKHYLVNVYTLCGGDTLAALEACDFVTDCGTIILPFHEKFESFFISRSPKCWFKMGSGRSWARELEPIVVPSNDGKYVLMGGDVH